MGFNGRCRPKNVKGHRWINYPNTAHKKCTKCGVMQIWLVQRKDVKFYIKTNTAIIWIVARIV